MQNVLTEILVINFTGDFINSNEGIPYGVSEIFDRCPTAQELCFVGECDREQVVEHVRKSDFLSSLIR